MNIALIICWSCAIINALLLLYQIKTVRRTKKECEEIDELYKQAIKSLEGEEDDS